MLTGAAGHGPGAVHRGLLRRPGAERRRPAAAGLRVPLPQPGDRAVPRRGRRAGRHARRALRRDRAGPRLGGVRDVPALRRADRHPHHRDAARRRWRSACGCTTSTASRGTCLFRPRRGGPRGRAAAGPDARHGRRRPGRRRGLGRPSRPDAHGGNMDTPELRAGTTAYFGVNVPGALLALGDGHCRQGEGEVCGTARGGRDAHRRRRRPDQGRRPTPWPRHRDRRLPDVDRFGPAAGGRLPRQPARPGRPGRPS